MEIDLTGARLTEDDLLVAEWKQLRSEITHWEEESQDFGGYDGSTRFWCTAAIFDIYWVAQKGVKEKKYQCYLTEDLELTGFREKLPFVATYEWKVALAEKLQWQEVVNQILKETTGSQPGLFEDL